MEAVTLLLLGLFMIIPTNDGFLCRPSLLCRPKNSDILKMGRICAVTDCGNSTYNLERWKAKPCKLHGCKFGELLCSCPQPFTLYPFPSGKQNLAMRKKWTKMVNRTALSTGKNWEPEKYSRICSKHFVDGMPTKENPVPTLLMGYDVKPLKPSRPSPKKRHLLPPKSTKKEVPLLGETLVVSEGESAKHDHGQYCFSCMCGKDCRCKGCFSLHMQVLEREVEISRLETELEDAKLNRSTGEISNLRTTKIFNTSKFLDNDSKVKHYTGLPNKSSFYSLLDHLEKRAKNMRYWLGSKKVISTKLNRKFKHTPRKSGPKRKLNILNELLLVLMKLRLGLTNEFLSDLFAISSTTCSQIFNTWIKLMAKELKPLIFWPDKLSIKKQMPVSLQTQFQSLRCTIDCTEFHIGRPRNLNLQALTWSNYKKHNTLKVLVGIAPNGMITFLSKAWGGRASDNYITKTSGFLDLIEPGDLIMADRGFTIREDLMLRNATLYIPPPSAGLEQQTKENVLKTKKIANARIHVERAIGRLKWFNLLRNTIQITLIPLIDDILIVCAALCNLLPPLVN